MKVKVAKNMQFREDYPKKHNLPGSFHESVPRVSKGVFIFSRLVGWMSPEYAEKFSLFALRDYLSTSPLSAALVVQSSWAVPLDKSLIFSTKNQTTALPWFESAESSACVQPKARHEKV